MKVGEIVTIEIYQEKEQIKGIESYKSQKIFFTGYSIGIKICEAESPERKDLEYVYKKSILELFPEIARGVVFTEVVSKSGRWAVLIIQRIPLVREKREEIKRMLKRVIDNAFVS